MSVSEPESKVTKRNKIITASENDLQKSISYIPKMIHLPTQSPICHHLHVPLVLAEAVIAVICPTHETVQSAARDPIQAGAMDPKTQADFLPAE